jgi:hypothetical protein
MLHRLKPGKRRFSPRDEGAGFRRRSGRRKASGVVQPPRYETLSAAYVFHAQGFNRARGPVSRPTRSARYSWCRFSSSIGRSNRQHMGTAEDSDAEVLHEEATRNHPDRGFVRRRRRRMELSRRASSKKSCEFQKAQLLRRSSPSEEVRLARQFPLLRLLSGSALSGRVSLGPAHRSVDV